MTANRLDELAQMSQVLTDSVLICDDLITDTNVFDKTLPMIPHWEAIQLRLEELVRLYGSAAKVVAEAFEAEQQRQQQPVEEEVDQTRSPVATEITDLINQLVRDAQESGVTKNVTLKIALTSDPEPTVH